jgi:DNA-binding MarR family transcriptional regulator
MTDAETDPAVKLQHFATRLIRLARASHKEHSISSAQYSVMALLSNQPGMSVVELARRESVAHPTMSRLVAGLIKVALVRRTANPADGRSHLLRLTSAGEQTYRDIADRRTLLFRMLLSQLSASTVAEIVTVADRMMDPLETVFKSE